jgi:aerobic carbon-monoxide dehydrogenase medium subunit
MTPFAYHKPATIADAVALFGSSPDSRYLAGGMTLLPSMKQRLQTPSALIDLSALTGLSGISRAPGALHIGAMTRHADVARSDTVKAAIPALAMLAGHIGDPAVRNCGTLGGSLANNDPSADYPAAVLALGATIVTDKREIYADQFFRGMFETTLQPAEVIMAVKFPEPIAASYEKFANPASRYALVGVFVARFRTDVRVAVTGAGAAVFRLPGFEAALANRFDPAAVEKLSVDAIMLSSDIHADAEFRAHLIKVMAKRAVGSAMESAREA